jgi:hypothetical protein
VITLTREQMCGLFGVDIAGFTGPGKDGDVREHMRTALYRILKAAFDGSGVPWDGCVHEDRGDGALIVIPAAMGAADLVDPCLERLCSQIRLYNRMSCPAARMQLRAAAHIGMLHHDGHGFVGDAVNLLFRLLETRPLKQQLAAAGTELAYIASNYVYENVVLCHPTLVDPGAFRPTWVRVKGARVRAWIYVPGARIIEGSTWS